MSNQGYMQMMEIRARAAAACGLVAMSSLAFLLAGCVTPRNLGGNADPASSTAVAPDAGSGIDAPAGGSVPPTIGGASRLDGAPTPANGGAGGGSGGGGSGGGGGGGGLVACGPNAHRCNDGCFSDSDPAHCGSRCEFCPTSANGHATCEADQCTLACDTGYHACSDKLCYPDTDITHCGVACSSCESSGGGVATCTNHRCEVGCGPDKALCNGVTPVCLSPIWDFESNTAEGWMNDPREMQAASPLFVSTARAHSGTHSLATHVTVNFAQKRFIVSFQKLLCASGGIDLGGKTISAWIYFEGPALNTSVLTDPYVYTTQGTSFDPNSYGGQRPLIPRAGVWNQIISVMPLDQERIVKELDFFTNLNLDGWTGTVFLDDISLK
jgi:hypothetical protein